MEKTLLFGNGLNLLIPGQLRWLELLEKIKRENKFDDLRLPNTMIFERILLERQKLEFGIKAHEGNIKAEISELLNNIPTNEFYKLVYSLGFKNYLTTNYDYSLNKMLMELGLSSKSNSTEDIYSIRRNTSVIDKMGKEKCKIWNIHGEGNKPNSIMLGLDHYCGSIGKLDAYLKGTYEFQENKKPVRVKSITDKIIQREYDCHSWVELFFYTDIHILGLSLEYSETDLWWILNKRARIMNNKKTSVHISNQIFYYTPKIEPEKEGILKSFNVKVVKPQNSCLGNFNWNNYYRDTIKKIQKS